MTGNVVFCDTETSGLDPDRHDIYEVALIDSEDVEHHWWLPLTQWANADPIALSIGRYHERHPHGNGTMTIVTGSGATVISHRKHLAGAVISFDEERLRRLCLSLGLLPSWHYHLIDVESLAVGWVMARRLDDDEHWKKLTDVGEPPWDSEELSLRIGVNPDEFERHTALGDARWAQAIYERVMAR